MKYKIITRKFMPDEGRYAPWITEFDQLKDFETAVRCAEAHFVLVGAYKKLDKDIATTCEVACGQWLDAKRAGYPVYPSMSVHFAERFGFMIVPESA